MSTMTGEGEEHRDMRNFSLFGTISLAQTFFFWGNIFEWKKSVWLTKSHSPCSQQMPFHCWTLELSNEASSRVMSVARLRTAYFYLPLIPEIVSSWGEPIIWATLKELTRIPSSKLCSDWFLLLQVKTDWKATLFLRMKAIFSSFPYFHCLCLPQLEPCECWPSAQWPCHSSVPCYFPRDNTLSSKPYGMKDSGLPPPKKSFLSHPFISLSSSSDRSQNSISK